MTRAETQDVRDLLFSWAISCASALSYLAQLQPAVAHGNVRPSNLLLCVTASSHKMFICFVFVEYITALMIGGEVLKFS